jgi:hypothetical protein
MEIPSSRYYKANKPIAGWNEMVRPARDKSLFWHRIWSEAGRPRNGLLADIMRRTRSEYHRVVRTARKNEDLLKKQAFAEAVLANNSRNFWNEVRKIKHAPKNLPSTIDAASIDSDIAEVFANTYKDLYNSVQCSADDLTEISDKIRSSIKSENTQYDHVVHCHEVGDAIQHLKSNKNEGVCGLSSDFFKNASAELHVHIALLITAMLTHGYAPSQLTTSTIIPIPKGNNADKTSSGNYRAISLSSIIVKIVDLIILDRYSDKLITSDHQLGFKRKSSTTICTMLVKEAITYYHVNDSDVYCTFLDATKAFDRVNYRKLFDKLFQLGLPVVILRLLFIMYTGLSACVLWNGVASKYFPVANGVRQGGILSPILFCVYIDGLISRLNEAKIGCFMGKDFVGVFVYADDVTVIAPTPSAMRMMLKICDSYAAEFDIKFNASKTKCLYYPSKLNLRSTDDSLPQFTIAGHHIEYVEHYPHLGHILCNDFSDDLDVIQRHDATVRQINDVLCYFGKIDAPVKLQLLYSFCSSLYGCELWNLACNKIDKVYTSWRRALKNIWKLPMNTHANVVYGLSGKRPVEVDIMLRVLKFSFSCLNSENHIVRNVSRHAAFVLRTSSGFGRNFIQCCQRFHVVVSTPDYYYNLNCDFVLQNLKKTVITSCF